MIVQDLETRVLERLGEDPNNPIFYTRADALAWLNAAQRMFVLFTLCLETTGTLTLDPGPPPAAFYSMLTRFSDWLLPLRVRVVGWQTLRPSRLADLAALDSSWSMSQGAIERYVLLGFDKLAVWKQPPVATSLEINYARCPTTLVGVNDVPEIPVDCHPALIDGAIPLLRAREGGQDWSNAMPMWNRFLDAAQGVADYVRARNKEQGYDYSPIELRLFDRSKLLMIQSAKK